MMSAGCEISKCVEQMLDLLPPSYRASDDKPSKLFALLTASYLPGTGRSKAIRRDIFRMRRFGFSTAEIRAMITSKTVFDARYTKEKFEKALESSAKVRKSPQIEKIDKRFKELEEELKKKNMSWSEFLGCD